MHIIHDIVNHYHRKENFSQSLFFKKKCGINFSGIPVFHPSVGEFSTSEELCEATRFKSPWGPCSRRPKGDGVCSVWRCPNQPPGDRLPPSVLLLLCTGNYWCPVQYLQCYFLQSYPIRTVISILSYCVCILFYCALILFYWARIWILSYRLSCKK